MQHPYQCLAECGNILLAASNSRIDSFNLKDGSYISSWICPTTLTGSTDLATDIVGSQPSAPLPDCTSVSDSVSNTPLKRRRLLDTAERAKTIERVTEPPKNHRNQQPQQPTTGTVTCPPTIISLTFTKTGNHVIAVTGDDKSIRVLEHQKNGSLMQLSFRNMPKRPCAIALTADGSSIVCADKFGDVYSLPLLVPDVQSHSEEPVEVESSIIADAPKAFVSAANHLTIHTARNRRALLNQMKQTQNREKIEIASGQELLLGHVSMLTDLALAEFGGRNYIITADRDEHVRISRGIPQTHIIEGFCLGHNEFVSRLCLPKTHPNLLISGGGDNELYSWRWLSGELSNRVDLKRHLQVISEDLDVEIDDDNPTRLPASFEHPRIAVSNIRHTEAGQDGPGDFIIVTCEAIPLIMFFSLSADGDMVHFQTIKLSGNPLDIITTASGVVVVSIDSIHEAGSTFKTRSKSACKADTLKVFHIRGMRWVEGEISFEAPLKQSQIYEENKESSSARLSSLLYNVENLRKRGGEE